SFSTNQGEHHEALPRNHGHHAAVRRSSRTAAKSGIVECTGRSDARDAGSDATGTALGNSLRDLTEVARQIVRAREAERSCSIGGDGKAWLAGAERPIPQRAEAR